MSLSKIYQIMKNFDVLSVFIAGVVFDGGALLRAHQNLNMRPISKWNFEKGFNPNWTSQCVP